MKKMLTVLFVVLMALTSATSVFAEADTKNVSVSYSVEESYTWSVPTTIAFDSDNKIKTDNVEVTEVVIAGDKVLNIYINGDADGEFKIVSDEDAELEYEVKKDDAALAAEDLILSVAAGTNLADESNPGVQELSFELTDTDAGTVAGSFAGVCTFEAKLEAVA